MRLSRYVNLRVRSSGCDVKAQIWVNRAGDEVVWLDNNWYPISAFEELPR